VAKGEPITAGWLLVHDPLGRSRRVVDALSRDVIFAVPNAARVSLPDGLDGRDDWVGQWTSGQRRRDGGDTADLQRALRAGGNLGVALDLADGESIQGDWVSARNPAAPRRRENGWLLASARLPATELTSQVARVVELVERASMPAAECENDVFFGYFGGASGHGGVVLSPASLAALGRLGLRLTVDSYSGS
jgi:hypothetical protein